MQAFRPGEIVLPAFEIALFDGAEVYRRLVAGKRTIYLDTNAWIALSDGADDETRACRDACLRSVANGQTIFPLSTASVCELLEQPREDWRTRQAELMDRLSLGVCFKSLTSVERIEVDALYEFLIHDVDARPSVVTMFTSMPDYLGEGRMKFPEGWTSANFRSFIDFLENGAEYKSLLWLATHMDVNALRVRHRMQQQRYVDAMTDINARAAAHPSKLDRNRLCNDERDSLYKSVVLPRFIERLQREPPHVISRARRKGAVGQIPLNEIFPRLRSLEMLAHFCASRTLNPTRHTRPQDFWDTEHALVAPIYGDAFVSRDGGLLHFLNERRAFVNATVLRTIDDLHVYIQRLDEVSHGVP
jgi:hypothetical protein